MFLVNISLLVVVVTGSSQLQLFKGFVVGVVPSKYQSVGSGCSLFITLSYDQVIGGKCCS